MPHWTEYMYREYVNKYVKESSSSNVNHNLSFSSYPVISKEIDGKMFTYNKYLKSVISSIHELVNSKQDNKKKGKEEAEAEKEKKAGGKVFEKQIVIYFLQSLSEDQKYVLSVLNQSEFDESNKIVSDFKSIIKEKITDKQKQISAFQFGAYIAKEVEKYGKEAMQLELGFTEEAVLNENIELIKKVTNTSNIKIVSYSDNTKPKGMKQAPIPGSPVFHCE